MELDASRKAEPAFTDETLLHWVDSIKVLLSIERSMDWYITKDDSVVAEIATYVFVSLCCNTLLRELQAP